MRCPQIKHNRNSIPTLHKHLFTSHSPSSRSLLLLVFFLHEYRFTRFHQHSVSSPFSPNSFAMSAARYYLLVYNAAMCAGWIVVLLRLLVAIRAAHPSYTAVERPLQLFQSAAVLEVIHILCGVVRASIITTTLQVSSRLTLVWGVCYLVPDARRVPTFTSMVAAWSLTEIPRYFYFAVSAVAFKVPRWLVWLRYSTFLPLYPIGAGSEWLTLFAALPYIKRNRILTVSMPNRYNFAFDYHVACIVVLALYIPGLPHMYAHMIRQRRKYVGAVSKAKSS